MRLTPLVILIHCVLLLSLVAATGCAQFSRAQDPRCEISVPLQWIAPHCRVENGRERCIPGHWHNPAAVCFLCTRQAPSQPSAMPPAPSAAPRNDEGGRLAPSLTIPRASSSSPTPQPSPAPPPANQLDEAHKAAFARLAAELARLRQDSSDGWSGVNGRLAKVEGSCQQNAAAIAGFQSIAEQLARRQIGSEKAAAEDRRTMAERGRELAKSAIEHSSPLGSTNTLSIAWQAFSLGGPVGLAGFAGLWLVARAVKHRRDPHNQASGREAPAPDTFPDDEEHAAAAIACHDRDAPAAASD